MTSRRTLLQAAAGLVAGGASSEDVVVSVRDAAAFSLAGFGVVGVFGLDWLLDPQFSRLLDNLAASPGAVQGVRVFGALSGGRDRVFPTVSEGVWGEGERGPEFGRTLLALEALVARGLTPFLPLTFFPKGVSTGPIVPPATFERWQVLVRGFLDAVVGRFGAGEVARWSFEVWNEPNMPPFWGGTFEQYLALYRATSAAVVASGHRVRLGGPVVAYLAHEGPALMERFLQFLRDEPEVRCDFVSLHRKGAWTTEEGEPDLGRLVTGAEETAAAILRLVPGRARGLEVVNDEADMMVGFDRPYPPRMTAQSASWLAASMIAHDRLSMRYRRAGLRFVASGDNANLQLARGAFDGRRMLMTPLSGEPADQVKLPVLGFYEMLRLMGEQRVANGDAPGGVSYLVTVGAHGVAGLITRYRGEGSAAFALRVRDLPWARVNVVQFRVDGSYTNAGVGMEAGAMRLAQELGVLGPPRRGVDGREGVREEVALGAFASALVWITPFERRGLGAPRWVEAGRVGRNVVLRWTPALEPLFYSYELWRMRKGEAEVRIGPDPLRAAMWVDTDAPVGEVRYAVRAVSASGVPSARVVSDVV